MQKKIAAKEICHTYFKQNGKSAALQINYKEFMTMSKVSQIITETVLKRMEEAEKNGEVFYWVKPFSEGSPNKPYSYDTGIPYRGINRILLDNDEFLTFAKVQEMNKKKDAVQYHIRKGAKANIVC